MQENIGTNNTNSSKEPKQGFWAKTLHHVWDVIKILVIALIIVLPIRYYLFQPFIVKGESMMPNYQDGNYLIVDEVSYRFSEPQRGDVVVFNTGFIPGYKGDRFIKRIMGLPGETIIVKDNKITVSKDGKDLPIDETKYLPGAVTIGDLKRTLGKDEYFVMGDNRRYSFDSRIWGVLPKKDIIGKVFVRLLPVNELSLASAPAY